jgi:hypothetical protein
MRGFISDEASQNANDLKHVLPKMKPIRGHPFLSAVILKKNQFSVFVNAP